MGIFTEISAVYLHIYPIVLKTDGLKDGLRTYGRTGKVNYRVASLQTKYTFI